MALWVFQMLFNLIMAGFAVAWLLARRQERVRGRALPARSEVTQRAPEPVAPKSESQTINTPLGSPTSTLSERQAPEHRPATTTVDAYDKADFLISRGMDLREVARQTGLSMAELQLIGKMSQKSQ